MRLALLLPAVWLWPVILAAQADRAGVAIVWMEIDGEGHGTLKIEAHVRGDPSEAARVPLSVAGCLPTPFDGYQGDVWYLETRCRGLLADTAEGRRGRLDFAPLDSALHASGLESVQTVVVVAQSSWLRQTPRAWVRLLSPRHTGVVHRSRRGESPPPPLPLLEGFGAADWARVLLAIFLVVNLPPLITEWARVQASPLDGRNPAEAAYLVSTRSAWAQLGVWLYWIAAYPALNVTDLCLTLAGGHAWLAVALDLAFFALPYLLAVALSAAVAHSTMARVQGPEWRAGDAVVEALGANAAAVLPLAFFVTGVRLAVHFVPVALLCWVVAFLLRAAAARWVDGHSSAAVSLPPGDLRDRVFGLAAAARLTLRDVLLLRTRSARVHEFSLESHSAVLTGRLIEEFSRREVDAVVAQGLGRFRFGHWSPARLMVLASLLGGEITARVLARNGLLDSPLAWFPFAPLFAVLVTTWICRRQEHAADAEAVRLCGDPEALITSASRLARIAVTPLHWGGLAQTFSTHPTLRHRVEAIAREGRLPEGRAAELLAGGAAHDDHYPQPLHLSPVEF